MNPHQGRQSFNDPDARLGSGGLGARKPVGVAALAPPLTYAGPLSPGNSFGVRHQIIRVLGAGLAAAHDVEAPSERQQLILNPIRTSFTTKCPYIRQSLRATEAS